MSNFKQQVGWMLLGVFSAVVAIVCLVSGFTRLIDGQMAQAILLFLITVVGGVASIAAFKQL